MKAFLFLLIMVLGTSLSAQIAFEPFAEIRIVSELHLRCLKKGNLSNIRLVGHVGVKSYLLRTRTDEFKNTSGKLDIFLAPNISANLLWGRGIGASIRQNIRKIRNQLTVSGILGAEWGNRCYHRKLDFQTNSLSGGMPSEREYAAGFSTNWVMVSSERNSLNQLRFQQRVGGLFGAFKEVSIAYTNDGPPFGAIGLGDGGDRMFTGFGQIAYTQKNCLDPVVFKLTYERYTGWEDNTYETANDAKLDYVEYRNNYTTGFTRGQYRLGIQKNHLQGGFTLNDFDNIDFQNIIHLFSSYTFHRTPIKGSVSVWAGLTQNVLP